MTGNTVTPSKKGTITIPPHIRKKLKIDSTTRFNIVIEDNKLIFIPVPPADYRAADLEEEARKKGYVNPDEVEGLKILESNKMDIVKRAWHRFFP